MEWLLHVCTKHWNDLLCKFEFEGSFRSHWAFIILWCWSPTACLIPHSYLKWLAACYCNQSGHVNGKHFPIQRGFKQGHVISPMLFNEAWNMPYTNGNLVCRIVELILDTAKFDVYVSVQVRRHVKGKSWSKFIMMEALLQELSAVGLHLWRW